MLTEWQKEQAVNRLRESGTDRVRIREVLADVSDAATELELRTLVAEAYVGATMTNSGYFIKSASGISDANAQAAKQAAEEIAAALKKQ